VPGGDRACCTALVKPAFPPSAATISPALYLAVLVFGLVVPLLPVLGPPIRPVAAPAPAVPAVHQVELNAPKPVVVRPTILDQLSDHSTIALTFDDGPDPQWTPQVLGILRRHGAVATFCMVGEQVVGNEHLVRQVVDAGMRLCDHSRTHDRGLPHRPADRMEDEILGAGRVIAAAGGGVPIEWFRAPGGAWSPQIVELAATHGMQPLG
jgi:peptidoglycan-N-acetylglucosamine deacetylase